MIVYTSVFGGYDTLKPHIKHPGVDQWICYTDDPNLICDGWDTVVSRVRFSHPRVDAKWWKCHPPGELGDIVVWVDGSVDVHNPDYFDVLRDGLDMSDLTMFRHPDRDCIYDEAMVSVGMQKYQGQAIEPQVALYAKRGRPSHAGLWASTTFARRITSQTLQFGAAWFAHNDLLTYQDQLSLPVVLEEYGIIPAAIPGNLWHNPWFTISGHASNW